MAKPFSSSFSCSHECGSCAYVAVVGGDVPDQRDVVSDIRFYQSNDVFSRESSFGDAQSEFFFKQHRGIDALFLF